MAQIIKPLKIDLSQESSYVYMKVKEGDDNSRKYQVIFTDCGIPKMSEFRGNELVTLYLAESGSNKAYANQDCTWENGMLYITFTSGMLSHVGNIDCNFVIIDVISNTIISSRLWHINVQRSLIDYEGIIKSEDFNTLNNLIKQALMIPDLIATFETSQGQINSLIAKINADITAYQKSYNKFNADATGLISALRSFLSECQTAENIRISNENTRKSNETKRQTDTATAISNANAATTKANTAAGRADTATSKANTAAEECRVNGLYARSQGDRVDEALQGLDLRLRTVDGGNITDSDPAENIYDGGTL